MKTIINVVRRGPLNFFVIHNGIPWTLQRLNTRGFRGRATDYLGKGENQIVAEYLSENPKLGELVEGTGGIRKLNWPLNARSTEEIRGVVYYYFKNKSLPVYLVNVFKPKTKQVLSKLIETIICD